MNRDVSTSVEVPAQQDRSDTTSPVVEVPQQGRVDTSTIHELDPHRVSFSDVEVIYDEEETQSPTNTAPPRIKKSLLLFVA